VGVADDADRAAVDFCDLGFDLFKKLRKLAVDEQDPVLPDGNADVAAPTDKHIDVLGDLDGLDLDFLEVLGEPEKADTKKAGEERIQKPAVF
jgi:hypothetical protein